MSEAVLQAVLLLTALGILAALILYYVSKKFYVYENPLIDKVEALLPSANCAGCGFPGCRSFAEELTRREDISDLFCPAGGNNVMREIAGLLGKEIKEKEPLIAVLKCNGSRQNRPKTTQFEGPDSCAISAIIFSGETDCVFGCLGKGDCVDVCEFDAMYIDEVTGLPVILPEKCTGCGACTQACPRMILELRPKNETNSKVYVACSNKEKGGIARKACKAACIGCAKCVKTCQHEAITLNEHLAYISPGLCVLCGDCVEVCPTKAITETNVLAGKTIPEEELQAV